MAFFVGAPPPGRWVLVCGGICLVWEPRPRGDGSWSARLIATRASLLQGHGPGFCGSPALGAMGCGVRGFSRRGRRSYRDMALAFVGGLPSGRFLVVCGGFRDGGVAPTGDHAPHFVVTLPSGRFLVVCGGFRDGGIAPTGIVLFPRGAEMAHRVRCSVRRGGVRL
jgi:hypothetical protein